jgi:hypothetical protein
MSSPWTRTNIVNKDIPTLASATLNVINRKIKKLLILRLTK